MTHQLDLMPKNFTDAAVLARIDASLPKPREVRSPRLPLQQVLSDELDAQPMEAQAGLVADATGEEMFHVECDRSMEAT